MEKLYEHMADELVRAFHASDDRIWCRVKSPRFAVGYFCDKLKKIGYKEFHVIGDFEEAKAWLTDNTRGRIAVFRVSIFFQNAYWIVMVETTHDAALYAISGLYEKMKD